MKIAIVIDANSNGGGGYYQSLRTLEILKNKPRGMSRVTRTYIKLSHCQMIIQTHYKLPLLCNVFQKLFQYPYHH